MSESSNKIDFLGKGWKFPISFNKAQSSTQISTGNNDIRESLIILLGTIPGERFLHPDFGCDLTELSFENLTTSFKTEITSRIKTAVTSFEPRIDVDKVEFEDKSLEGVIFLHIFYTIRSVNSRANMVYPYYLKEGTNL